MLRRRLGSESFTKGDGTFFMSFTDMLERFHHMDVAKTREGWIFTSCEGIFMDSHCPLGSSRYSYEITPSCRTWAFVSVVQKKKRANTKSKYWYSDPSMILLKKRRNEIEEWACETVIFAGVQRSTDAEVFLDPMYTYRCLPFSCVGSNSNFRLTVYSAESVTIEKTETHSLRGHAITLLHKRLLGREHKLYYPVSSKALILVVHGSGCLYFLTVNTGEKDYLSTRFEFDLPEGLLLVYGKNMDSVDTRPQSQRIVAIVASNGRLSAATHVKFRYLSSFIPSKKGTSQSSNTLATTQALGDGVDLSLASELLVASIDDQRVSVKGGDEIETFHWIPQLGATT